ncbi:MAG: dephospho-CoA kinase [Bacteroidota bacterium]
MSKLPLHIGLTGGIGSGKSLVASIFERFGFKVYYADQAARDLMNEHQPLVNAVKQLLGEAAYTAEGILDRAWVGQQVFNNPEKLQALNAIVHPETARDYLEWGRAAIEGYVKPFLLKEAAILFESGAYKYSDAVITVYAPKAIRLERVMKRDGVARAAVEARMNKQWPEQEKLKRADFVITNDGQHHLIPQVQEAIRFFQAMYEKQA